MRLESLRTRGAHPGEREPELMGRGVHWSSGWAVRAPALARHRRVRGATLTAKLRRPASLRPCRTIHGPAFGRSDEILYLVEKAAALTLPDFHPSPRPCGEKFFPQPPGVERMRSTGDQGWDACVLRVAMDGDPGLARSRECVAQ